MRVVLFSTLYYPHPRNPSYYLPIENNVAHITSPVQVSKGISATAMTNTYEQLLSKAFIIIIIIIIICIIIIYFVQGIFTYILETNYVPREHSVAAILLLLFMVLI